MKWQDISVDIKTLFPGGCLPLSWGCIELWKNCIKSDFKDMFLKLAINDRRDMMFLLTSKFCSQGVAPAPGLYTCRKSRKKVYKIRLQRDFFETCSTWPKWREVSVDIKILFPRGCQPLPRGYIHVENHEKKYIKSDFKEIFLKLVAHDRSDERFLLTSKFCPLGLSAPDLQLYTIIKSWKDVFKFRGWRDSF